ncbi:MAG: DUF4142 domain-containing protein [Chitinophagales bacterium]
MTSSIQRFSYVLFLVAGLFTSCANESNHNDTDSKDVAEEQNEDKFSTKAGEKDAQFVVDVVSGNYYEVRLSNYAERTSANAEVKSMAKKMAADHSAFLTELKNLASSKSISIPNEDSTEVAKAMNDLKDSKMENFDKEWMDKMIDKHKASISKLEGGLNDVTDPEIKSWIESALPTIRSHYDMLNQMHHAMK